MIPVKMLSHVSHNKKFPKTFRHIQSDCMVIKMTTCGVFSVYLNLYHPCSLLYVTNGKDYIQILPFCFSLCPLAKRWPVHSDPVGGDDARYLSRDEISL